MTRIAPVSAFNGGLSPLMVLAFRLSILVCATGVITVGLKLFDTTVSVEELSEELPALLLSGLTCLATIVFSIHRLERHKAAKRAHRAYLLNMCEHRRKAYRCRDLLDQHKRRQLVRKAMLRYRTKAPRIAKTRTYLD